MPTAYTDGLSSGVHALLWVTGLATPTIGLLVLYALFTPTIRTARTRWTSYQLTRRARRSGRTTQA